MDVPAEDRPLRATQGLSRDLERFFEDFFPQLGHDDSATVSPSPVWAPRMDVSETRTAYWVWLDLPGVRPGELTVDRQDNHLIIRGAREEHVGDEEYRALRVERRRGRFYRVLRLPEDAQLDQVDATFKHGVLTLVIPRAELRKPTSVPIR